jgi:hypothetical protein
MGPLGALQGLQRGPWMQLEKGPWKTVSWKNKRAPTVLTAPRSAQQPTKSPTAPVATTFPRHRPWSPRVPCGPRRPSQLTENLLPICDSFVSHYLLLKFNVWTDGWTVGRTNRWTDGWMDRQTYRRTWIDKYVERQIVYPSVCLSTFCENLVPICHSSVSLSFYISANRQTDRQTDRQTEIQTDWQTDRQPDKHQTDRHKDRHTDIHHSEKKKYILNLSKKKQILDLGLCAHRP